MDLVTLAAAKKFAKGGGSGGGDILVVHVIDGGKSFSLDKTWQEIHDATFVKVIGVDGTFSYVSKVFSESSEYKVISFYANNNAVTTILWIASSANGYPSY